MIVELPEARALLRAPTPDDLPFVIDTWVRSQCKSPAWRSVDASRFRSGFSPIVAGVLKRPDTKAIVACDEGSPETIYGFAVWSDDPMTLHMVYVRGYMRGLGLGKALALQACPHFGDVPILVTATTPPLRAMDSRPSVRFEELARTRRLTYDPFRIMGARDA